MPTKITGFPKSSKEYDEWIKMGRTWKDRSWWETETTEPISIREVSDKLRDAKTTTPAIKESDITGDIQRSIAKYKASPEGFREKFITNLVGNYGEASRDYISKQIYKLMPDIIKPPVTPPESIITPGMTREEKIAAAKKEALSIRGAVEKYKAEDFPTPPPPPPPPPPPKPPGNGDIVDDQKIIDDTKQKVVEIGADVNADIKSIFDEAGDDEEIDIRDSAKILADLREKIETGLTTEAEKPQSMADLFQAERTRLGLDVLETELADIDAEMDLINTNLLVEAEKAGEKLLSMGEIGREKGPLQKRADRELAYLNIERKAVAQRMDNKLSTLEIMMNLTQQDFANTSAYYKTELDKQTTLYNLYKGEEEAIVTRQDKLKDEAQFNLNTIHNLLKAQGSTWDSLSEENRTKIKNLEVQAGLPQGITESFAAAYPDSEVMSTITWTDEAGNKTVSYIYKGADGKPGVTESVILGKADVDEPPEPTTIGEVLGLDSAAGKAFDSDVEQEMKNVYKGDYGKEGAREKALENLVAKYPGLSREEIGEVIYGSERFETGAFPDGYEERIEADEDDIDWAKQMEEIEGDGWWQKITKGVTGWFK